ncbi:MAG TPA: Smr/MutS family protein [Myxococcota bacterium]|jgi:DNA-nicking Smr family endonuclease|nr:Smr/MutS family protein [Myxococcota bacterium]
MSRPPREDDERAALEAALRDVKPLRRRTERASPPRPRPRPAAGAPSPASDAGASVAKPTPIRVERRGAAASGLGDGADRALLRRLRSGEIAAEVVLDLHGLSAAASERAVHTALADAYAGGVRCLRIVHGRGARSPGGVAVLRDALPGWLADARAAPLVLAFTTAAPRDGGDGATWVYLRRARPRSR